MSSDVILDNVFNDTSTTKFGAVMFDLVEDSSGQSIPQPGSGWASIEGGKSFRIKSSNELANDVKWLTNLSQNTLWKSGAVKQPKLKHSSYLRTDVGQIMKEVGAVPPLVPIADVCEIISKIFTKVMLLAVELYGVKEFAQKELYSEIKNSLLGNDRNISLHLDEALSRSYQDLVVCENLSQKINETVFVTLKCPRLRHATNILKHKVPLTLSDWDFIPPEKLPSDPQDKINYLNSLGKPYVAKCSVSSYFLEKNLNIDLSKLLNLGEAFGEGGKVKERNWVCQPEINYMAKFSDINPSAAFVAQGSQSLDDIVKLPSLGPLQDFSYSLGLLMESVWVAFASRSLNPKTRTKSLVSPRASWLKSIDRFETLKSAMLLSAYDFHIISYGYGAVNVAVKENRLKELIELSASAGLMAPQFLLDKCKN